jgi:hypothetical protein
MAVLFNDVEKFLAHLLDIGFVEDLEIDETNDRNVAHGIQFNATIFRHRRNSLGP